VHAEFVSVPAEPAGTPCPRASTLSRRPSPRWDRIALHGLRLAEPQVGEQVAVIGLGLLGLLAAGLSRASGCAVFGVDLDEARVARARQSGFAAGPRSAALEQGASITGGRGFDIVLICADTPSSDPVELAGRWRAIAGASLPSATSGWRCRAAPTMTRAQPARLALLRARTLRPALRRSRLDYPIGYVRWTEGRNLQAFVDLLAGGRWMSGR